MIFPPKLYKLVINIDKYYYKNKDKTITKKLAYTETYAANSDAHLNTFSQLRALHSLKSIYSVEDLAAYQVV